MHALTTTAWVGHDLSLATIIGGTIFGKFAFHPAIHAAPARDQIANQAWRRFSIINLMAHLVVAGAWLPGRMLCSHPPRGTLRAMTIAKDAMVVGSLASAIACTIAGRALGRRVDEGASTHLQAARLNAAVRTLGTVNLLCNLASMGFSSLLAMQPRRSSRFAILSRWFG